MMRAALATLFLPALLLTSAHATVSDQWRLAGGEDFAAGTPRGTIVASDGTVRPGPPFARTPLDAPAVWSLAAGRDGILFAGTGNEAKVFRIREGEASEFADLEGTAVTALLPDGDGAIAATFPGGRIYRIERDGAAAAWVTLPRLGPAPDEEEGEEGDEPLRPYVWGMIRDGDGSLLVATGPRGTLYRIDRAGKVSVFFESEEDHLTCLARDGDGILAGGSPNGFLYRIDADGNGFILHDFPETEVRAVAADGESVVAAVNGPPQEANAGPRSERERAAEANGESGVPAMQAQPGSGQTQGRIVRLAPEGTVETLMANPTAAIADVAVDRDGAILAAAGDGRLHRIRPDRITEILFDPEEGEGIAIGMRDGILAAVGTAGGGAVHIRTGDVAEAPTYLSPVLDARFPARWGRVDWRGRPGIRIRTRSGNTTDPATGGWSDWSDATGEPGEGIASPGARCLQVEVTWEKDDAVLEELIVSFRIRNQRPRVGAITIVPVPVNAQGESQGAAIQTPSPGSMSPPPDRENGGNEQRFPLRTPLLKITWQASDPDGDALEHALFYRRRGTDLWIPIDPEDRVFAPQYVWDTESIPDGWYEVRAVARDAVANPAGEPTYEAARTSEPFRIDHTAPVLRGLVVADGILRGEVRDPLSPIALLEFSVDGGPWRLFHPSDGVLDGLQESFRVPLGDLPIGDHTVAVRAADRSGNLGADAVPFRVR